MLWPEQDINRKITKELIPSGITGYALRTCEIKKEKQKKLKEEQKEKRIKEKKNY